MQPPWTLARTRAADEFGPLEEALQGLKGEAATLKKQKQQLVQKNARLSAARQELADQVNVFAFAWSGWFESLLAERPSRDRRSLNGGANLMALVLEGCTFKGAVLKQDSVLDLAGVRS